MDTIGDMLTRIRNALLVKKPEVKVPYSKINLKIAEILKKEGFINDYSQPDKTGIIIILKYIKNKPAITHIKRISKLSRRIYLKKEEIKPVLQGLGIAIISTSQGIITDKEARKRRIGGEVICEVW
jgi:small subunit ribosomal protein S8